MSLCAVTVLFLFVDKQLELFYYKIELSSITFSELETHVKNATKEKLRLFSGFGTRIAGMYAFCQGLWHILSYWTFYLICQ
jgi:hypothetical protein